MTAVALQEPEEHSQEVQTGRPTVYDPAFIQQAEKLCMLGATDDELANFFNVHRTTLYRWKNEYPEFCYAIRTGKDIADERVERSLYQMATGYQFTEQQAIKIKLEQYKEEVKVVDVSKHMPAETTAAIFWLKNRRAKNWRDKIDLNHRVIDERSLTDSELIDISTGRSHGTLIEASGTEEPDPVH